MFPLLGLQPGHPSATASLCSSTREACSESFIAFSILSTVIDDNHATLGPKPCSIHSALDKFREVEVSSFLWMGCRKVPGAVIIGALHMNHAILDIAAPGVAVEATSAMQAIRFPWDR